MVSLLKCIWGPKLYKMYSRVGGAEGRVYEPNAAEAYSDNILRSLSFVWSLGIYTSPVFIAFLGKRGYFSVDGILSFTKFFAALSVVVLTSFWLRGLGRFYNAEYTSFLSDLLAAQAHLNNDTKRALMRYDFHFSSWPKEYSVQSAKGDKPSLFVTQHSQHSNIGISHRIAQNLAYYPSKIIGYIVAHSFGRHLVYPGSVGLLQTAMGSMLLSGRSRLVEEYRGERFKIETKDNNSIDVMVVDRRNNAKYAHGNTLVICTEGNAGFYEVGIMSTPLEVGYSVIGWNHPGFGGSTGAPFPDQEAHAIDAVIQFAVDKLKFQRSDIVLFAWSIGGYSATWAAMNYDDIRGVILDATFDDLVPLAVSKMPNILKPIIVRTIRDHMNLENARQLSKYSGPVLLIRRTKDEMITTAENQSIASNRGNDLMLQFLHFRYPRLMDDHIQLILRQWLIADKNARKSLLTYHEVDDDTCLKMISSYFERYPGYPAMLGEGLPPEEKIKLALYLANVTMVDYNSTHCTPLPKEMFKLPLDLTQDNGFIKVTNEDVSG